MHKSTNMEIQSVNLVEKLKITESVRIERWKANPTVINSILFIGIQTEFIGNLSSNRPIWWASNRCWIWAVTVFSLSLFLNCNFANDKSINCVFVDFNKANNIISTPAHPWNCDSTRATRSLILFQQYNGTDGRSGHIYYQTVDEKTERQTEKCLTTKQDRERHERVRQDKIKSDK